MILTEYLQLANKGEKEMKEMQTEVIMVLDRSGSMGSCADDVVGGFDNFIKEQREGEGEASVTLAQFDDRYEIVYESTPVDKVAPLAFSPRGSTALLDAIGKTIIASKDRMKTQRPGPDVVIFVIVTDGHENASKEFSKTQIASMTKECEEKLGWKFIYLGANQDAFSEAGSMGIGARGTMNYDANEGTQCMFRSLSKGTSAHRSKTSVEYASRGGALDAESLSALNDEDYFSDEDRKDQTKFGIDWKVDSK